MYAYSFSARTVSSWLSKHHSAIKDLVVAFEIKGFKRLCIKLFREDQTRWNSLKYLIKRIERGQLADVWLEHKRMSPVLKQLKRVFSGTFTVGMRPPVDLHLYRLITGPAEKSI
jgi:hypothetical protein